MRRFSGAGPWGTPQTIVYVSATGIVEPRVALYSSGLALLIWTEVVSPQLGVLKGVFVPHAP